MILSLSRQLFALGLVALLATHCACPRHEWNENEALAMLKPYRAGRVSSSDPRGGNEDYIVLPTTGTITLAELRGPGAITHIWITLRSQEPMLLRKVVLRMYWDGEEHPSVEAPIGDFFGQGYSMDYSYAAQPLAVGTVRGLNSFWYMPFLESARITVTHEGDQPVSAFYYYINYRTYDHADREFGARLRGMGRFHAHYRQQKPAVTGGEFEALFAEGRGHYVGCNLFVQLNSARWWGEGDDRIYIDGESHPSIEGTGTEDYFCGGWGFFGEPFATPYFGSPLRANCSRGAIWSVYRHHIQDPIPFRRSIRVAFETIHSGDAEDPGDDYSSVAYWYQVEPHRPFDPLPPVAERIVEYRDQRYRIPNALEGEHLAITRVNAAEGNASIQDTSYYGDGWSLDSHLFFQATEPGDSLELRLPVDTSATYTLVGYFTRARDYGMFEVLLNDNRLTSTPIDGYDRSIVATGPISLGTRFLDAGSHSLTFRMVAKNPRSTSYHFGLDCIVLERKETLPLEEDRTPDVP
jgi:hypothetical protein